MSLRFQGPSPHLFQMIQEPLHMSALYFTDGLKELMQFYCAFAKAATGTYCMSEINATWLKSSVSHGCRIMEDWCMPSVWALCYTPYILMKRHMKGPINNKKGNVETFEIILKALAPCNLCSLFSFPQHQIPLSV